MKKLAAEFVIIVAGILVALGVDEWRQGREELRIGNEHLSDVAQEIRSNLGTVERIQARSLARKLENLQTVIQFLNDPDAPVADASALLHAFARSTAAASPWLVNSQFEALTNSGNVRLLRDQGLAREIAGIYQAPEVLFKQVERIQGDYPVAVAELIPAQLQSEFSQLSGYLPEQKAPPIADDADLTRAIAGLRARRIELLGLARGEAAVATAKWYALMRLQRDMQAVLVKLAPWDRGAAQDANAAAGR